jgi:hypothetical protein
MRDVKPTDNKYLDEQTQRFRKWQKKRPVRRQSKFCGVGALRCAEQTEFVQLIGPSVALPCQDSRIRRAVSTRFSAAEL